LFKEFLIDHSHGIATLFMSVCSQEMGGYIFGDVAPTVIGGVVSRLGVSIEKQGKKWANFFLEPSIPLLQDALVWS
jgi:hypothetical protein